MDLFLKNAGWVAKSACMNSRNIRRRRFAFVELVMGESGVTGYFSVAVQKQCSSRS